MRIRAIGEGIRAAPAYRGLRRTLQAAAEPAGGARASGLVGSSRAAVAAALAEDLAAPVLVVAPTGEAAERWLGDLETLLGERAVGHYPQWEVLPYDERAQQREIEGLRLEFLIGLLEGSITVGVTTARALVRRVPAPAALESRLLRLAVGDRVDRDRLIERLVGMGFEPEAMVAEVGTFSVRGGIVDVFAFRHEHPVRLELAGDEIESIRAFDPGTQRSISVLERVEVLPARELPPGAGPAGTGEDGELRPLGDYLPPGCLVVWDEAARVADVLGEAWHEAETRWAARREHREPPPEELYLDPAGVRTSLAGFRSLELHALPMSGGEPHLAASGREMPETRFRTREPDPVRRSPARLAEILRADLDRGARPVILCDNLGQLERLEELLPGLEGVVLEVGWLSAGFVAPDAGLAVYTDHEIFERRAPLRRQRRYATASTAIHLTEIVAGDYLAHLDYGIGRYQGLERLRLAGGEVEVLKLAYAEGEILYVPVDQLERIERYTSEEGAVPTLHRMGSGHWERQKARARQAIAALADELLALQAEREVTPGYAFSPDTAWQREMEAAFVYEDTPDQRAASEAVKRDMERPRPMDRLICGDVGYGKTEVAIRAAFKAVQDGKQVAVLVPTTVLAAQHLETFGERLADFPVRIGMLSRFQSAAENRAVIEGVRKGSIDIVIGTHRLLSGDVAFADLGLLVIDEEQRFGVRAKERLRALRTSVDVLTLSATPIPRTLQMGLMGLREMSLIETPPRERTPIVTWVTELDEGLIEEAIRREVDRGGQVFFVHNRVQTIDLAARRVERLVPDLRIGIAHGQLAEGDLSAVMLAFFHGDIDVLVTSAIIESGLDVPRANTILVERADRFGLADLYQLRGRVGRSYHRAYCYLLTPPRARMTEEGEKRLRIIEHHSELGAGYRIALRDLEMRGAGNLLGADQSGFIAALGFETYLRLLEETVAEMRGEAAGAALPVELGFDADAYLPSSYIPDDQQKLALYRRLSRLRDEAAILDFALELEDRYGPPPDPVRHLCDAARLRALATRAGIVRLRVSPRRGRAELRWAPGVEARLKAIQEAAADAEVRMTVGRVDPLELTLTAETYDVLSEALFRGLRASAPEPIVTR
ncbi:MAG TPA: transcription-repair coupling factor [Gemmatimonadota bacterium]|nr:transcription-repair coupling factor [Gemmatimonadota bacterium]